MKKTEIKLTTPWLKNRKDKHTKTVHKDNIENERLSNTKSTKNIKKPEIVCIHHNDTSSIWIF